MPPLIRRLALLFLLLPHLAFSQQPSPPEDLIVFTNGDQLSGTLLREVKDSVTFKSDMAGELTIPLTRIRSLRTAGRFAVLRHGVPIHDSRRIEPQRIEITPLGLLEPDAQAPVAHGTPAPPIPLASVAYLVDAETFRKDLQQSPTRLRGWRGTATLGATLVQATQHGGTFTAAVALTRQIPPLAFFRPQNRTSLDLTETYGTSTTPVIPQTSPASPIAVVVTSIFHADAERDQYLSRRTFLLAATSFDHNFAQGLDLQQLYGLGAGITVFEGDRQQLDLKADLHYLKQQFFTASTNQNLIGSSFTETFRRTLPDKLQLTQSLNVIPAWNDRKAYSANATLGLTLPVTHRLSFANNLAEAFLNNPSPGYRKNSLTYSAGITYSLK